MRVIAELSAEISLVYEGTEVLLKDGGVIHDIAFNNSDLWLKDARPLVIQSAAGSIQLIPKDRINKKNDFKRSLMYDAAALSLEAQDIADIATWLQSYQAATSPGDGELPPAKTVFVRKWTVDEAADAWSTLKDTGDPVCGKTIFATARCVVCHGTEGTGGLNGPDLTSLARPFSPRDILTSIIEPSRVIDKKYAAETLILANGLARTGRVVSGDDRSSDLEIVTSFLEPTKTMKITKSDVVQRQTSPVSAMPSGLLDYFSKDEIVDLIAYLLANQKPPK